MKCQLVARFITLLGVLLAFAAFLPACTSSPRTYPFEAAPTLRVMTWNIWHGGREDGEVEGPRKVSSIIRLCSPDLVAMQETYGSGEKIAADLGYHFQPRGTNVSIHSRYPIIEDISVFEPFKCVGALVEIPHIVGSHKVAFYSIWLPYDKEIWEAGTRPSGDSAAMLAACASSATDLAKIRDAIDERLSGSKYAGIPIIIAGDFNSMSHLDYTEVARAEYRDVIEWQTSRVMTDAGYRDVYRDCNPRINRALNRTWTPRFPDQEQDRIDFIYARGNVTPKQAFILDKYIDGFPSDHAAVIGDVLLEAEKPAQSFRVVSYNIKHGRGMDDKVDLARTAKVLERFTPDIVGLQEVDLGVSRSGSLNEPFELAAMVAGKEHRPLHAAFGAFMPLQGGHYGMAILSRYPIARSWSIVLPTGNEPRVALAARVVPPGHEPITVVNVHFDWVDDDGFRYAQARVLADELQKFDTPYILLGDFNDRSESRTLELFRTLADEIPKVDADGSPAIGKDLLTYSSTEPEMEIDFIFVGPKGAWPNSITQTPRNGGFLNTARVMDEPVASDHRPVVAEITPANRK
jgi:endonuclease/exonuclease/phosphatase family metal-dependent hydrolase